MPALAWLFSNAVHKSPSMIALGRLALGRGGSCRLHRTDFLAVSGWSNSTIKNAKSYSGMGVLPLDSSFK